MQFPTMAQQQVMRAIPVQIQANAILGMNSIELGQMIEAEAMENPAVHIDERTRCLVCGFIKGRGDCPVCESFDQRIRETSTLDGASEREYLERAFSTASQEVFDPFRTVASLTDIREYLKHQARMSLYGRRLRIAEYVIDSLDDDLYFRESLYETAEAFAASAPEVEEVLRTIQSFDPPGVGARDLRECLLIQLRRAENRSPEASLAEQILADHWGDFLKMKLRRVASNVGASVEEVKQASEFIRENLTPHPASLYREPFSILAPRDAAVLAPDVVVRCCGDSYVAEVVDRHGSALHVDDTYQRAYEILKSGRRRLSEQEARHTREHVERVRTLIEAISIRKKTLGRVASYLVDYQRDYIAHGPLRLRPLKQKELAKALGLHESTVCRAVANKYCRLPSAEVVSFDVFFDAALPVREMIAQLIRLSSQPLTDGDIAKRLADKGINVARRTVAKYREQLRLPPYQLRAV